ncbi:hypothetical protein ACFWIB_34535 [Streptomyces sp. NPDC127051]|uniref:hypothetical protein n=1 Tax=Streptomyces sp. NPDC127051 TaxID=3347119 RepID=UPI00365678E8
MQQAHHEVTGMAARIRRPRVGTTAQGSDVSGGLRGGLVRKGFTKKIALLAVAPLIVTFAAYD